MFALSASSPSRVFVLALSFFAVGGDAAAIQTREEFVERAADLQARHVGGKKLMVSWALGEDSSFKNTVGSNVGAVHTWSMDQPSITKNSGLKFLPMIWGAKNVPQIKSKLTGTTSNTTVMTFNEPQEPGQSNISPSYAASLWKANIEPLRALGYTLACPATSGNPNGITWMDNFFKACNGGCTCDYMAVHFYDNTFTKLKNWINSWRKYGKPLIISEFADQNFNGPTQPNWSQVWQFYTQAVPWLDAQQDVVWYAPFGWFRGGNAGGVNNKVLLMSSNGQATDLGNYVKNF